MQQASSLTRVKNGVAPREAKRLRSERSDPTAFGRGWSIRVPFAHRVSRLWAPFGHNRTECASGSRQTHQISTKHIVSNAKHGQVRALTIRIPATCPCTYTASVSDDAQLTSRRVISAEGIAWTRQNLAERNTQPCRPVARPYRTPRHPVLRRAGRALNNSTRAVQLLSNFCANPCARPSHWINTAYR